MAKPKTAKKGYCKPGGPFCIGMEAMLDANAARGLEAATSMNFATGVTRTVIVHSAVYEGQKKKMYLTWCPCCRARILVQKRKSVKA